MKFAAIFVLFANAFSAGMMFLASVFISRYGGKELFGFFSVVLGVVVIGAKITTLGLDVAIVRFLPKYHAEGQLSASGGIKRAAIGITLFLSVVSAISFAVMLHYFRGFPVPVATAAAAALPLAALLGVFQNIIRADGNVSRAVVGEAIVRPAVFMVLILTMHFLWIPSIGNFGIGLAYSIALGLSLSVSIALVVSDRKVNWGERITLRSKHLREWLSHGINLLLSESSTALLNQAPILLAGVLLSAAEAGEMSAVIRLAMLVIFALTAVQSIITPFLSQAMSRNNTKELQALVARASAFTMIVAVPVCGGFVLLAPQLLGFFGDGYVTAVPLLRIMLGAYLLYAAAGPAVALLTMTGHHKVARTVVCSAATAMIFLGAISMTFGGLVPAVWVAALIVAVYPLILAILCRRTLGVDPTVLSLRYLVAR
ncbi:oligosaccharide flippase family protein [uncultured Thalassospira sp.]|uniref:oligosaccharide flippase family protein n=1 Tax=uncultured Thalassospira sp. TaxID=404382 RepID=UPI002593E53F|nr:oligosaccharide flippase family protein [uncultured Thalassospira sp.]